MHQSKKRSMNSRFILLAASLLAVTWTPTRVIAGANDYAFEPVQTKLKKGADVTVAVRLVKKATKEAVPDAVITKNRIDMGPEGMPTMASPLTPVPSSEPGVYSFKTSLPMEGHWQLSVAAKVQGEPETVVGRVTLTVTP
jgi:hypothetical protein